ncbi:retrotransposable element Tf2 [Tanacetum coccineum]
MVPNDQALREKVMTEAHSSPFTIHPGSTKMYRDLKQYFWWKGMKQDVAIFVSRCMTCQQVKIEHQRASGLLQPLEILCGNDEFPWISYTGLPTTQKNSDAIWVAWFVANQEIVRLHGTPTSIVSDRDPKRGPFQTLEDMLGHVLMEWTGSLDDICAWASSDLDSLVRFEIMERIRVRYRICLALPPQLSHVHDVFHVSLLRGYHYHPLHVASYPFDQIQPDMSLSEEPESILDRQERVMRNKVIPFVKILWKNHPEREATWETEESMRASYPYFFV